MKKLALISVFSVFSGLLADCGESLPVAPISVATVELETEPSQPAEVVIPTSTPTPGADSALSSLADTYCFRPCIGDEDFDYILILNEDGSTYSSNHIRYDHRHFLTAP